MSGASVPPVGAGRRTIGAYTKIGIGLLVGMLWLFPANVNGTPPASGPQTCLQATLGPGHVFKCVMTHHLAQGFGGRPVVPGNLAAQVGAVIVPGGVSVPPLPLPPDFCLDEGDGNGFPAPEPCIPQPAYCVHDAAFEHHVALVFAHMVGSADDFASWKPTLQRDFLLANGNINWAAAQSGVDARLKVQCETPGQETGTPAIEELQYASPSTLHSDVGKAFADSNARYLIFYHGSGTSSSEVIGDSSPGLGNANNHYAAHSYVLLEQLPLPPYDAAGYRPFETYGPILHELTHALGAVLDNAPHALTTNHCSDGLDVMCYDDSQNQASIGKEETRLGRRQVPTEVPLFCDDYRHYDCNGDDYFNLNPPECIASAAFLYVPPACYLKHHWNLGDPANLFLRFSTKHDPRARMVAPSEAKVGRQVEFNASASTDVDHDALRDLLWDFGDGSQASGVAVRHAFSVPGDFAVTLTVYDEYEGRNVTTKSIMIRPNVAPTAAIQVPAKPRAGSPIVLDGSASSDPDGTVISYAWDFGDGATGDGPQVTHTFASPAKYQTKLVVTDDDGAEATSMIQVHVLDAYDADPSSDHP